MNRMRFALVVALAAGAVACGGSSQDDSGGDAGVNGTVTAAGLTLQHPDGAKIEIPAGALATGTQVTIRRGGTSAAGSAMYVFQPEGLDFDGAVVATVTLPLPGGMVGAASVYWSLPNSDYEALAATVASGKARASVGRLSWGHAGPACSGGAQCSPPWPANDCQLGTSSCVTGAPQCFTTGAYATDGTACATGICATQPDTTSICVTSCNSLNVAQPPLVGHVNRAADNLPAAGGGNVANGTYYLIAVASYGNVTYDTTYRGVLVIGGTTARTADGASSGVDDVNRWGGGFSTSGTVFTLAIDCPVTSSIPYAYTATATQLTLYYLDEFGTTFEYVYLKQ